MKMFHAGLLLALLGLTKSVFAGNILEELNEAGATTLAEYFERANMSDVLTSDGPFTLFAPINEAFDELTPALRDSLDNNDDLLDAILSYHIVQGKLSAKSLPEQTTTTTLEGSPLHVNLYLKSPTYKGFVTANGVRVVKSDWSASNGVIHFINQVIHPIAKDSLATVLANDGRFKTLLAAFEAAAMTDLIEQTPSNGPITLFAPTDEAFAKIPDDTLQDLFSKKEEVATLLSMHIIPGTLFSKGISWAEHQTLASDRAPIATQVFKGPVVKIATSSVDSTIVDTDLVASNGVIHAIDTVL